MLRKRVLIYFCHESA